MDAHEYKLLGAYLETFFLLLSCCCWFLFLVCFLAQVGRRAGEGEMEDDLTSKCVRCFSPLFILPTFAWKKKKNLITG